MRLAALLMDLRPGKAEFMNNSGLDPETCGLKKHRKQPGPEAPDPARHGVWGFSRGSLVDGVRDTVEHFRGAVAAGRIDVERALEA